MQNPSRLFIQRYRSCRHRNCDSLSLKLGLAALFACNTVYAEEINENTNSSSFMVDFKQQEASSEVRYVAGWVRDSSDNGNRPYAIIDKVNAKVFVFDARGNLQGADAALVGMARGDDSAMGVGNRKLSAIGPGERTTPAGRFIVNLDYDAHGKEILLIDYAASISLHPIVKGTPAERRAQRLESATPQDNRISYGCINVPVKFYQKIISPAFTKTNGLVYILPETSKASDMFGSSSLGPGGSR